MVSLLSKQIGCREWIVYSDELIKSLEKVDHSCVFYRNDDLFAPGLWGKHYGKVAVSIGRPTNRRNRKTNSAITALRRVCKGVRKCANLHTSTDQTRQTTRVKMCDWKHGQRALKIIWWDHQTEQNSFTDLSALLQMQRQSNLRATGTKPSTSSIFPHRFYHKDAIECRAEGKKNDQFAHLFTQMSHSARRNIWQLTPINAPTTARPSKESSVWVASSSVRVGTTTGSGCDYW